MSKSKSTASDASTDDKTVTTPVTSLLHITNSHMASIKYHGMHYPIFMACKGAAVTSYPYTV